MSEDPATQSTDDKAPIAVTHLIEKAEAGKFEAWAIRIAVSESAAHQAGKIYYEAYPGDPKIGAAIIPDEVAAYIERSPEDTVTIRCIAFYADVSGSRSRDWVVKALKAFWESSGAGRARLERVSDVALHATVGYSSPGSGGITGHPHIPWVIVNIDGPGVTG